VNQEVLIKDRWRGLKKTSKFLVITLGILGILALFFSVGYFLNKQPVVNQQKVVLENPIKNIVFANANVDGVIDKQKVIEQATLEFNQKYIDYILLALGVNTLYKSAIGYGNPKVEFAIDDEIWSSEIIKGGLNTIKNSIDDPDIRFHMPKKEIIEFLLAQDPNQFVIDSVSSGRTQIELIAGKPELVSKGYLGMYTSLTGKEPAL